ncbi:VOC family protein [Salinisphaera sp. Q1T1-3]|uniref:VOC family protein n=1 Tax=Salinisphaera sp. Q1T1-3 TaxID=2321229 RepID=UPI000E757A92|nr:VOC family protein [Salinisphaera sp. Q1T1-3]RJS94083.1 ring-cleaving dioxygenase [Salinisphaera sp. Q1T1-3]
MTQPTPGLHHVTVISGEPRINRRFYTETLGLRLVKKTVNFDDPGTYHLYYGDRHGQPGTALTFFPFPQAAAGRDGVGQARRLAWRVSAEALGFWHQRLREAGLDVTKTSRFGEPRLHAVDPDGFAFALAGVAGGFDPAPATATDVPAHALLGAFDGIDVASADPVATARVLTDVLGYRSRRSDDGIARFEALRSHGPRSRVDLHENADGPAADSGRGSVHHIAFRAADTEHQNALADAAAQAGLAPTPVIDRQYFESVYFREPGGVLFEIATDAPGFAVDEPVESLGEALCLPPQYEPRRAAIEAELPAL